MPTAQDRRYTRSKSCGERTERELRSAGTNAQVFTSSGRKGRSPTRVSKLPARTVNIELPEKPLQKQNKVSPVSSSQESLSNLTNSLTEDSSKINTNVQLQSSEVVSLPEGSPPLVGDNRGSGSVSAATNLINTSSSEDHPPHLQHAKGDSETALMLVLEELREIKQQMITLSKMESTTASLVDQLAMTTTKTEELETKFSKHETKMSKLKTDFNENMSTFQKELSQQKGKQNELESTMKKVKLNLDPLKTKISQQEKQLKELHSIKEDFANSSEKTIAVMNDLVETQRAQVDTFNSGAKILEKEWKQEVMAEVDRRFQKLDNEKRCNSLKDQAFRNRFNLVVLGLPEDTDKSTFQITKNFIENTLNIKKIDIYSADRLGTQPISGSAYARPILVVFNKLPHRNRVWRKRKNINQDNANQNIRIQADLPKALREGVQSLYRVAAAASKIKGYENASVSDYQLVLNGEAYQITDLESLPIPLRPSNITSPRSETHLVFFSKHAKLSNHFPSKFTIKGQSFGSMEHFLAVKRAELSGKENLIQRALKVQDPVQAKRILNELHKDHQEEWSNNIQAIVMEGLKAKFGQNSQLKEYLCNTGNLIIGEASTNSRWGIGMDLNNPEVLNPAKWLQTGNLLGRSLMNLRKELTQGNQPKVDTDPNIQRKQIRPKNTTRNAQPTRHSIK